MSRFGALPNTSNTVSNFVPTTGNFSNDDDKEKFCIYTEVYEISIDWYKGIPGFRNWFTYNASYTAKITCKENGDGEDLGDPTVKVEDGVTGQKGQHVKITWGQIRVCKSCTTDPKDSFDKDRYFCGKTVTQASNRSKGTYNNVMKELWGLAGGGQPPGSPIKIKPLKKALKKFAEYMGCEPDMKCKKINEYCKKKKEVDQ